MIKNNRIAVFPQIIRLLLKVCFEIRCLAQIKAQKTPAPPILTEIIPNKLFISNLEGAQNVNQILVCCIG
jgi:hypothetical protein